MKFIKLTPMGWAAGYALLMPLTLALVALWGPLQKVISNAGAASWVQGIGTIAAFFAAIWAGTIPLRVQRDRSRAFARAISHVANLAERDLNQINRFVLEEDGYSAWLMALNYVNGGLPETFGAILKMPFADWPSPELFVRVRQAHAKFEGLVKAVKKARDEDEMAAPVQGISPADWTVVNANVTWTRNWLASVREEADRLGA